LCPVKGLEEVRWEEEEKKEEDASQFSRSGIREAWKEES
jgi:hypothetical protein